VSDRPSIPVRFLPTGTEAQTPTPGPHAMVNVAILFRQDKQD
jgi:hypothetical protein